VCEQCVGFFIELKSSVPKVTSSENNIFGTNLSLFVLVVVFIFSLSFVGMIYPPNVVCCYLMY
jgi:hypothetical protein